MQVKFFVYFLILSLINLTKPHRHKEFHSNDLQIKSKGSKHAAVINRIVICVKSSVVSCIVFTFSVPFSSSIGSKVSQSILGNVVSFNREMVMTKTITHSRGFQTFQAQPPIIIIYLNSGSNMIICKYYI